MMSGSMDNRKLSVIGSRKLSVASQQRRSRPNLTLEERPSIHLRKKSVHDLFNVSGKGTVLRKKWEGVASSGLVISV